MAIEGRKEAKEIKRLEEEKVISNQRRKRKLSRCKKNFPIEVGGRSFMGENSVSEGVGEMPSNYIIQEQSQDFIGWGILRMQYLDGTRLQTEDLPPGPVVTSLEGGGGGGK